VDSFSNVPLPEWRQGRNKKAEDSPVLYVKGALETGAVSILGKFHVASGGGAFILRATANKGGIFGDVAEFRVDFGIGGDQFVSIPLKVQHLPAGVYKKEQVWVWTFRRAETQKWIRVDETRHKIFVILDSPGSPWMAARHNSLAWPWTTALESVCEWAEGATTADEATAKICLKLLAKGKGRDRWFIYELDKTFNYFVEHGYFQFQQALAVISGDRLAFHNVNCVDAASLVVTFANLIGARLKEAVIDRKTGRLLTRKLLPLGGSEPGGLKDGFAFHEVALSDGGDVWDICFELKAGRGFVPTIKVPFSDYSNRLLEPPPGQLELTRRAGNFMISPAPLAAANYFGTSEFKESFVSAKARNGQPRCFIRGLFFRGGEIPGWKMVRPRTRLFSTMPAPGIPTAGSDPFVDYLDTVWIREGSKELMRLEAYVAPTRRFAVSLAIRRGTEIGEDLRTGATKIANEVAFSYKTGNQTVQADMRVYGNVMCFPRTIKGDKSCIAEFQQALEELMLTQPVETGSAETIPPLPAANIDFPGLASADVWWRFFCPTGWLHSEAGRLVFDPGKSPENQSAPKSVFIHGCAMSGRDAKRVVVLEVRTGDNT
jgi:hypothetical protein